MSYVEDTLQNDEVILITPELHWINFALPITAIFGAIILIAIDVLLSLTDHGLWIIAVGLLVYAASGIMYVKCREMAVTNKRVVLRKGVIASDGDEMRNIALTGIEVEQSVMGRLLNFGNICFTSAGSGGRLRVVFENVKNPRRLKAEIEDAIEQR